MAIIHHDGGFTFNAHDYSFCLFQKGSKWQVWSCEIGGNEGSVFIDTNLEYGYSVDLMQNGQQLPDDLLWPFIHGNDAERLALAVNIAKWYWATVI